MPIQLFIHIVVSNPLLSILKIPDSLEDQIAEFAVVVANTLEQFVYDLVDH